MFVPPRQTVNAVFYVEVITKLRKHFVHVHPAIANNWWLYHDNAPRHTSFRVMEYLAQLNLATLPHPPYSPNLAPTELFLFPRIKSMLKGKHHGSVEVVQQAMASELNSIPVQAFLEAYED
ncbi:UNVERIFIED_CONTAM: Histone-lysine N-methyltransferase SETMAR [Trichonephila clavipes]